MQNMSEKPCTKTKNNPKINFCIDIMEQLTKEPEFLTNFNTCDDIQIFENISTERLPNNLKLKTMLINFS